MIVVEPPGGHASRTLRALPRRRARARTQPVVVVLQHRQARASSLDLERPARCRPVPEPRCDERHRPRGRAARGCWPGWVSTTRRSSRSGPNWSGCPSRRSGANVARAREPVPTSRCWPAAGPGLELRVRRPSASSGAARRQPGIPHGMPLGGGGRALVALYARETLGLRPACRREHACGIQRHDRGGDLRVARRSGDGAAADVSPCGGAADPSEAHGGPPTAASVIGALPRRAGEFRGADASGSWSSDLSDQFEDFFFLEMGVERGGVLIPEIASDPEAAAIYQAGSDALRFVAEHLPGKGVLLRGPAAGHPGGHVVRPRGRHERSTTSSPAGFPVEIHHEDLDRSFVYPGARVPGAGLAMEGPRACAAPRRARRGGLGAGPGVQVAGSTRPPGPA